MLFEILLIVEYLSAAAHGLPRWTLVERVTTLSLQDLIGQEKAMFIYDLFHPFEESRKAWVVVSIIQWLRSTIGKNAIAHSYAWTGLPS